MIFSVVWTISVISSFAFTYIIMINLAKFIQIVLLQFEQNESSSSSVNSKIYDVMTSFIFTIIVKTLLDWFCFRKIINKKILSPILSRLSFICQVKKKPSVSRFTRDRFQPRVTRIAQASRFERRILLTENFSGSRFAQRSRLT